MSRRSSSKTAAATPPLLQFRCRWMLSPPSRARGHSAVVLQFLSLRLFSAGAVGTSTTTTKSNSTKTSACADNFVEVRVGRNSVRQLRRSRVQYLYV